MRLLWQMVKVPVQDKKEDVLEAKSACLSCTDFSQVQISAPCALKTLSVNFRLNCFS